MSIKLKVKSKNKKKQLILPFDLGIYELCRLNVKVQLTQGWDGSFTSRPNAKDISLLTIGLDAEPWWKIINVAHHEAEEFCMIMFGYAFLPTSICCANSTTYVFHFDHGGLIRVHEEVSYFLSKVLPDLASVYNAYQKDKNVRSKNNCS